MTVGDLVTLGPESDGCTFLVINYLREADPAEDKTGLGPLWELYNENYGLSNMHEKWMEVISESR